MYGATSRTGGATDEMRRVTAARTGRRRALTVALLATLVIATSSVEPALAACDPGRSSNTIFRRFGRYMGVNPGIEHKAIEATVDNTAIPFMEVGRSYAWMELAQPRGEAQPDGDQVARISMGLSWSPGQGRLESTGVRVIIEDEEGDAVLYDRTHRIGDFTFSWEQITRPRLKLEFVNPTSDAQEAYRASINGTHLFVGPGAIYAPLHGAEGFTQSRLYTGTNNDGSQVPGGSSDPQYYSNVVYTSNVGTAQWGSSQSLNSAPNNGGGDKGATWDVVVGGAGYAYTYDSYCSSP